MRLACDNTLYENCRFINGEDANLFLSKVQTAKFVKQKNKV